MRYQSLDVLRGIAILGTLATNVWIFTNREGLMGYIARIDDPEGGWLWVQRVLQQLAQGKFLGLLTVMFGIGLAIQHQSALRRGQRWPGRYPWRAGLLFIDGLLHFALVAEFDVLMGYAVTGLVVAFILASSLRAQRRWVVATAGVHLAMLALLAVGTFLGADDRSPTPREPLHPNPYADGSFLDLVGFRLDHVLLFRLEPVFILPMTIALFVIGAWLYNAGVLADHGARLRRALMIAGAVAAPVDLALGVLLPDTVLLTRYGLAPVVALGLLAAVAELYVRRPHIGWPSRRLSEVGRMALSCYVFQNIVASTLCYGWGLGVAARLSPNARVPGTIGIYLLTCTIIGLFAHLWLRRFQRGPLEWLWNASYQRLA